MSRTTYVAPGAFELVDDDETDLTDLLDPAARAIAIAGHEGGLAEAALLEAAVHFDEQHHPRWPKGTPKGGQFIRVGQSFSAGGKQYEVAHVVKGKIYAHRAGGRDAEMIEVKTKSEGGVTVAPIAAPTTLKVSGGRGQESTVTAISPYVDHASHDPSIPIPTGSKITPDEWKRFGKVDQEHYTELQERFGSWKPAAAKPLVDAAYTNYSKELKASMGAVAGEQAAQQAAKAVKAGYSMQYGSSSGMSLSLVGAIKKLVGGHSKELTGAEFEARERGMVLQGEHKAAVQWDLYNRSHSPDISAFHKSGDQTSYWDSFITGNKRIFSGLSQSFHYRASFFGDTALATPLAIRHVLLASQSAQPIPGSSHFPGELEISVPEQLVLDKRSFSFTFTGNAANGKKLSPNAKKWLESVTKAPVGGKFIEQLKGHFEKGESLPIPPEPANIVMDGANKLWKAPEASAWDGIQNRKLATSSGGYMAVGDHFFKNGKSYKITKVDPDGTAHGAMMGSSGATATVGPDEEVPHAQTVATAGLKAGDYVMGLQGSRYIVVADPGDPSGYGLTYVEVGTLQNYYLKHGATRQFYRLEGHYAAKPVSVGGKPAFDPAGWTQGAEAPEFTAKLKPGDKFKVEGGTYEVVEQLPTAAATRIMDLDTGKLGQINNSYKTPILVPKEGYVPPPPGTMVGEEDYLDSLTAPTPEKGDFLAIAGEKWEIQGVQATGPNKGWWKLKRPGKPGMQFMAPDDPQLTEFHRPSDYVIGPKAKLRDIPVGSKFHMGAGAKQKPYLVISHGGPAKPTIARDLSTGKEMALSRNASYGTLIAPPETPTAEATVKTGDKPYADLIQGDPAKLGELEPGDQFVHGGTLFQLVVPPGSDAEGLAQAAEVGPGGHLGTKYKIVGGIGELPVTFHEHGHSVPESAVSTSSVPPDPSGLQAPPNFAGYGSAYASGGKAKGGFSAKHDRISEMGVGTIFRDKNGGLWKVKENGHAPVITDGKANYAVDGQLRGRANLEMGQLPGGDSSPPVGGAAPAAPELIKSASGQHLQPNLHAKVGDLAKGDLFESHNGTIFKVSGEELDPDLVHVINVETGVGQNVSPDVVPPQVAMMVPPDPGKQPAHSIPVGSHFTTAGGAVYEVTSHDIPGHVSAKNVASGEPQVFFDSTFVKPTAAPAPPKSKGTLLAQAEPEHWTVQVKNPDEDFEFPTEADAQAFISVHLAGGGELQHPDPIYEEAMPPIYAPKVTEPTDGPELSGLDHKANGSPGRGNSGAIRNHAAMKDEKLLFVLSQQQEWNNSQPDHLRDDEAEDAFLTDAQLRGLVPTQASADDWGPVGEPEPKLQPQPGDLDYTGGAPTVAGVVAAGKANWDSLDDDMKEEYGPEADFIHDNATTHLDDLLDGGAITDEQHDEMAAQLESAIASSAPPELDQLEMAKALVKPNDGGIPAGQLQNGNLFTAPSGDYFRVSGKNANGQVMGTNLETGTVHPFLPAWQPPMVATGQPVKTPAEQALHDEGLQAGIAKAQAELAGTAPAAPTYTPGLPPPESALKPYSSGWGPGGKYPYPKIGSLPVGQQFTDKTGTTYSIVGHSEGKAIYEPLGGGPQHAVPATARVKTHGLPQLESGSAAGPVSTNAPESPLDVTLQQLKEKYGFLDQIPTAGEQESFIFFKSAWGTGGKYKHPELGTLSYGQQFTDKAGTAFTFVAPVSIPGPKNQAIIVSDVTGEAMLVNGAWRVKLKQRG